ncbi:Uncharacterised protein [uncultured Clostridium sp.]|uniref:hypothetical protein n=1 Tax=uncultured Clostridium sp. TaxID=59620 RepID=UPI00082132DB|nr:hypothetical protein [uncultured Clostridium sp.]SCI99530.1 Uncharacterised protein [uncultured Clostridium sp.]
MEEIKIIFDKSMDKIEKDMYTNVLKNSMEEFIERYGIDYKLINWITIHNDKSNELEDYEGLFVHYRKIINIYGVKYIYDFTKISEVLFHELNHAKFEKEIEDSDLESRRKYYIDDYAIVFENEYKAYYNTYEHYLRSLGFAGKYYFKLINYLKDTEVGLNNGKYSDIKKINLLARKVAIIKIFTEYKEEYKRYFKDEKEEYYQKYLDKCVDLQNNLLLSELAMSNRDKVYQKLHEKIRNMIS